MHLTRNADAPAGFNLPRDATSGCVRFRRVLG